MMNKVKYLLYLLFIPFMFTVKNTNGQMANKYIVRKGYLIYFDVYGWFFQPCDDSPKKVMESLNSSSFSIRYGTDGFNDALRDFESNNLDKMRIDTIFYHQSQKKESYAGVIKYQYVEMTYKNNFTHTKLTQNIPACMMELSAIQDEKKKYKLGCLWFDAVIDKILIIK